MPNNYFKNPIPAFYADSTGDAGSSFTLTFYAAGTTTIQAIYEDSDLLTELDNPISCDANGRPNTAQLIWVDPDLSYKVVLKNDSGTILWTADDVAEIGDDYTSDSGTFTLSLQDTGGTPVDGTVEWWKQGSLIFMQFPAITITVNAANDMFSGATDLPVALDPNLTVPAFEMSCLDNTSDRAAAEVRIVNRQFIFAKMDANDAHADDAWSGVGKNKGIFATTICYKAP